MKKLLTLAILVSLAVLLPIAALGAVHDSIGDFAKYYIPNREGLGGLNFVNIKTDHWFSIDRDIKFWKIVNTQGALYLNDFATLFNPLSGELRVNQIAGEYYCNDQTFGEITYTMYPELGTISTMKGSYLTDSGFFIGLDYGSAYIFGITLLSPGYRIDLGNDGFLAISADWLALDEGDFDDVDIERELGAWDVDFKYYTQKAELIGQLYIQQSDLFDDNTFIDFAVNYQVNQDLVIGGFLGFNDDYAMFLGTDFSEMTSIGIGCTWEVASIVWDARFTSYDIDGVNETLTELSGMFDLTNQFSLGLGVAKFTIFDNPEFIAKSIFDLKGAELIITLRFADETYGSQLFLGYQKNL